MKYKELKPQTFKLITLLKSKDTQKFYKKDIAKELSVSISTIDLHLRKLVELGYIKKSVEGGKNGLNKDLTPRGLIIKILK